MKIIRATKEMVPVIKEITYETIKEIYPRYYPAGAVAFFLSHHSEENIKEDVLAERVYLLEDGESVVGTVTIKENEVARLFVVTKYQKKGYGRKLLSFAEEKILEDHDTIRMDASFSAKQIYKKRGYKEIEYNQIKTENGDYLCYDVMEKRKGE